MGQSATKHEDAYAAAPRIDITQAQLQSSNHLKKRLKKVAPGKCMGRECFLASFLETQLRRKRNDFPDGFLDLEQELWGDPHEINKILLRQWYIDMAPPLIKNFDPLQTGGEPSLCTYIVAGNKGTGKTVFSLYLLQQSLIEGLIVAYRNSNQRFWIVGNNTGERDVSSIKAAFDHMEYEPALAPGVYECNGSDELLMFDKLTRRAHVIHIVDVGDAFVGDIHPTGQKVVISSPNNDKLTCIGEIAKPIYVFMTLWSREELQLVNAKLPRAEDDPSALYISQTDDILEHLIEIFGGVPRLLFRNESVETKLNAVNDAIVETSFEVWQKVFAVESYLRLPKGVPGILVHIRACRENPSGCVVEFSSPHVGAMVTRYFLRQKQKELLGFLNATNKEKLAAAMRGFLVEEVMHLAFTQSQGFAAKGLEVAKSGPGKTYRALVLPKLNLKTFRFLNMQDFTTIADNDYYQPMISNFPAVDAVALMDKSVFLEGEEGSVIVGFQATVSSKKRKPVKRDALHRVRKHIRDIIQNQVLEMFLVFVTVVDGIDTKQTLGKPKEDGDDEFVQFVIRSISAESVMHQAFTV